MTTNETKKEIFSFAQSIDLDGEPRFEILKEGLTLEEAKTLLRDCSNRARTSAGSIDHMIWHSIVDPNGAIVEQED